MLKQAWVEDSVVSLVLDDLAARAVEGDLFHLGVQRGQQVATVAVGGASVTVVISFTRHFVVAPLVFLSLAAAANTATYITLAAESVGISGFTLRVNAGIAQAVTASWLAIGRHM